MNPPECNGQHINEEIKMPKVGQKKFAYTAAGKKAASKYAKKKGKKVKKSKGY